MLAYKNSHTVIERRKDILYYDCTNFFFETEEADDLRKYGRSKQHQPLPIVGMGMFMDHDGIPLAFDIFPGNKNEQPTLKPLEKYEKGDSDDKVQAKKKQGIKQKVIIYSYVFV